jgi:D-apiose dehydrogenase
MRAGSRKRLRVGLAGAGMISRHHLIAWSKLDDVEVVAVCDPEIDKAKDRAREFGIASVYGDARAMLDREAADVLDIASPVETHAGLARLAAARGMAVLCQKPLTASLLESELLVKEVLGQGRLMVHENWRFRAYYRKTAGWLRDGRLGDIHQCRLVVRSSGMLPGPSGPAAALERQPFLQTLPRLIIAELLIHHLDVVRWLLGPLDVVAARAARTLDNITGETFATILLQTRKGSPVIVEGNFAAGGYPPTIADELEIIGTSASVVFRGGRLELLGVAPEKHDFDLVAAYQGCFDSAIAHFVDCLETGKEFETNPIDNLETLRLVEQAYLAADKSNCNSQYPGRA